jgi:hypothetical protein
METENAGRFSREFCHALSRSGPQHQVRLAAGQDNMALEAGGAYRLLAATHFGCQVPNLSRDSKFVKPVPGTLQEGAASFQTTHWTRVLRAGQIESTESAQQALSAFCVTYWPPLYAFLRHRRYPPTDAQDLVQAFFVYLLQKNTLRHADQEKGRLRTFLLTALQNFLMNEHDRARALKRGGNCRYCLWTSLCQRPRLLCWLIWTT